MTNKAGETSPSSSGKRLFVGQLNAPSTKKAVDAFTQIFDRHFYTNHGPLVTEFEAELAKFFDVKHVICMTNGTMALMVAAKSIGLRGDVVVPAFTFPATAQALSAAGLNPVFCDVDPDLHNITVDTVRAALTADTGAIVGVHMWGRACGIDGLQDLADEKGLDLIFDAAHAVGCTYKGRKIGGFGSCEVFSFHATKVLGCAEGGCVTTNEDDVAAAVRTAANFHDQQTFAQVPLRTNAKMSEAQAAMGLLSLEEIDTYIAANRHRYLRYQDKLADISGISFCAHAGEEDSNFQYVVCGVEQKAFGASRDQLLHALHLKNIMARRYFNPGLHKAFPYAETAWNLPSTDLLCSKVIQFPSGSDISDADIDRVCDAVRRVQNSEPAPARRP